MIVSSEAFCLRGVAARRTGRRLRRLICSKFNPGRNWVWFLAEILFLRGIDPSRLVGSVDDLSALVDLGHRLLDANKTRAGHSSTGDTTPGRDT